MCGSRWYLVQVGNLTRHVHADHLITALDNEEASTDPGNSFEPTGSVSEPDVCVQVVPGSNFESQSSCTSQLIPESNQTEPVPSLAPVPETANLPVPGEAQTGNAPEITCIIATPNSETLG